MEYDVHVEWLTARVRVFPRGAPYGTPYEWAAAVQCLRHGEVDFGCVKEPPSKDVRRAVMKRFGELGFQTISYERYAGAKGSPEEPGLVVLPLQRRRQSPWLSAHTFQNAEGVL